MSNSPNQLLILVVPDPICDNVIDDLITLSEITGFSLSKINGYSREHSHFNLNEQVEGYREMNRFEIIHHTMDTEQIMDKLAPSCRSANVRYWQIPLIATGTFGES